MEDAFNVFKDVLSNIMQEKGAVKDYNILAAEYKIQTEIKSNVDNKFINIPATAIFPGTNIQEWYSENVRDVLLKGVDEFEENESGW